MFEVAHRARTISLRIREFRVMNVLSVWVLKASGVMTTVVIERKSVYVRYTRWSGQEVSRENSNKEEHLKPCCKSTVVLRSREREHCLDAETRSKEDMDSSSSKEVIEACK